MVSTWGRSFALLWSVLSMVALATAVEAATGHHGHWRLVSPLGAVTGRWYLVVEDSPAAWRCEIGVEDDGDGSAGVDLLRRRGRGWTLCGGEGGDFVQPWHESWQEVGPSAGDLFASVFATLNAGPTAKVSRRLSIETWDDWPPNWRPPVRAHETARRLRRRLTSRGLGRGGEGLVLRLDWRAEALTATSTRWPGALQLRAAETTSPGSLPSEAFLPLWPLAEFLP